MKLSSLSTLPVLRSAIAAAAVVVCAGASAQALPQFTLNPTAAGLSGAAFTADNILISDYSTVRITGTTFSDTGFLSVSAAQLGGSTFTPGGLNSTYGMYIAFNGSGTTTTGNLNTTVTTGSFTNLDYELRGYNGTATFGFDASNNPTETATGEVVLARGSLINGTVVTLPVGGTAFSPSASAQLNFVTAASTGPTGFFQSPNPFYNVAFAAFTNTTSQVTAFNGGFRITQGGGAFNFAPTAPIPEPETYALMLAGLGVVGFMARRRRG